MTNVGLVAGILILSAGDIAPNPGPFDLRHTNGNKGISICQWNIQCLTGVKFEQISLSLMNNNNASNKLDILILTETFGTDKVLNSFYQIPGYDLERLDRKMKSGRGIIVYVNSKLSYNCRGDLESPEVEVLWIEVFPYKSNWSLLFEGIYRPPSTMVETNAKIIKNIENSYLVNKELVLLGDFNVDAMNAGLFEKNRLLKSFTNLHLTQMVHQVTRPSSRTCLDHVWLSHPERFSQVTIKEIGLFDHLPTVTLRRHNKQRPKTTEKHDSFVYRHQKN